MNKEDSCQQRYVDWCRKNNPESQPLSDQRLAEIKEGLQQESEFLEAIEGFIPVIEEESHD